MNGNRNSNLNDSFLIHVDGGYFAVPERTPTTETIGASVTAHFDQLESRLIEYIERADAVVGCVAWLTSKPILEALSAKAFVSILIQKEDFLRPDLGGGGRAWKSTLRQMYDQLKENEIERHAVDGSIVCNLSTSGDPRVAPIRCVGFAGSESSRPRMHHKFLVFCSLDFVERAETEWPFDYYDIERYLTGNDLPRGFPQLAPNAVWTGSFNLTQMATNSLENAVYIEDARVAEQFYREWEYVFALSEPLDWEHEYCAPQYRIGT